MDVLTQHNDNSRTGSVHLPGLNAHSRALKRWTLLNEFPVDGAVYAQSLYVEALRVQDGSVHDVVIIATASNTVYAFDVHSFRLIWRHNFGPPDRSDESDLFFYLDPETHERKRYGCSTLSPGRVVEPGGKGKLSFRANDRDKVEYFIGIQSTPVIDRNAGRIYVSYRLGGATHLDAQQRLAALDLSRGIPLGDVRAAQDPGFRIESQRQRASLLLSQDVIFLAFASRCEDPGMQKASNPNGLPP